MTPEQLDEIKKLAEAATPGPWQTVVDEFHADSGAHQVALHDCFTEQDADKNAAFIGAMREYALPLVKALEEAWEALDEREGDMHARIRAGYDKAVADSWRAHCARIEKERDEARADYEAQTDAWLKEHHRYNDAMDEVEKLKAEVERLKVELAESHERRREWARRVGRMTAEQEDMKAEVERLRGIVEVNDQRLADVWDTSRRVLAEALKERDEARAEAERLKAALEEERAMACEEPNPKCSCQGCSYAREKALKESK